MTEFATAPPRITLLSDFGPKDAYIGVMKGVIATIAPHAIVEDLSHGIGPQNVVEGAFLLASSYSYFPPGTIHVAVVDPGVGGGRAILAARDEEFVFLAPDNGLLGGVFEGRAPVEVVRVENDRFFLQPVSHTFHGRDIFAPVAAHIAQGARLSELGPPHEAELLRPWPAARAQPSGEVLGEVIYCDHFGNCVTNVQPSQSSGRLSVSPGDTAELELELVRHYSQAEIGRPLAVIGSSGYLEISVRDGNARVSLAIGPGTRVRWSASTKTRNNR